MERESFEDDGIARILNRDYICIKVDREERPDVDSVYMSVCQAMNGQGGWPLTILMTPDCWPLCLRSGRREGSGSLKAPLR